MRCSFQTHASLSRQSADSSLLFGSPVARPREQHFLWVGCCCLLVATTKPLKELPGGPLFEVPTSLNAALISPCGWLETPSFSKSETKSYVGKCWGRVSFWLMVFHLSARHFTHTSPLIFPGTQWSKYDCPRLQRKKLRLRDVNNSVALRSWEATDQCLNLKLAWLWNSIMWSPPISSFSRAVQRARGEVPRI